MRAVALLTVALIPVLLEGCKSCSDQQIVNKEKPFADEVPAPHDIGSWLSMRVTDDGKPAVAYYDRTSDALGYAVATVDGDEVTWATEEVDSYPDEDGLNPGDAGKYASLAIASDGTAWVGYQDTTNGTLKYATRTPSGGWTKAVADIGGGAASDAGYWASVAIDGSGNPVIAHYDHGRGDLRVARWNGTAFAGTVVYEGTDYVSSDPEVPTATGDAGEYVKILVGSDGTEYIAFYDRAWGALRLASGGASGYSFEVVDPGTSGGGANVGQWPDMVLDGDTLSIAYQDVTNQDLKLATGRPGSFTVETVDTADYVGADSAIYTTGAGVSVLYFDGVQNDMRMARQRDGAWVSEAVTGTGAASGYHNETVVAGGVRYAACYDYTNRSIWFSALP